MNKWWWFGAVTLFLSACSTHISDYEHVEPRLALDKFFVGELVAYGMVQDRSGKVTQRFRADIVATWDGNQGILDEVFYWDDGREETRVWEITKTGPNSYEGTAGDVVGTARGTTAGNALHWVYQLEVPWRDGTIAITLDDWMFLLDDDRLVNKTEMRKFGFRVGEITIFIERKE
ncbi:DUF3833 domain-containing protein [Aliidiomarina halalkaliphila]|uniref:DUF3833 domain-containing protein n=1 Tax=Aliidiomarina halalkaliphila TaxID=2593535 RepID=A0A552X482_9GAMM|nr:DUF3833 domain-containing protein [Aliidiomarina halalkaliphila]TRW49840.1 DUF3833 domain-containing protein [Aliidiomarina halalkaliphila]